MVRVFDNQEAEYLNWVQNNPQGFVVNVDRKGQDPAYPMVHLATHLAVSSPKVENYTTHEYIKICSLELAELETHALATFGRRLNRCKTCMRQEGLQPINRERAEHYQWGNGSDGWHLLKSDSLSVIEERVSPGEFELRHLHNRAQQFFYVLAGVASIEVDGELHQIEAGSGIHIPANTPHQLFNHGNQDLRFLVISEPKSHGDRILL
jgi:mannose-6-phosphate isomerase-like protein (cupin superfamily)